jgi:hypothetical protein
MRSHARPDAGRRHPGAIRSGDALDRELLRIGAVERLIEVDAGDDVTAVSDYASGRDALYSTPSGRRVIPV